MTATLLDTFKAARRAGVPLLAVQTPDQLALVSALVAAAGAVDKDAERQASPLIRWDQIHGFTPLNKAGEAVIAQTTASPGDTDHVSADPVMALMLAVALPPTAVLMMVNAQRVIGEGAVPVALLNLRDPFKSTGRMVVLLGPAFTLPPELINDVVLLDEELPGDAAIGAVVDSIYTSAGGKCKPATRRAAVDALRGLPLFAAETAAAMSLTPTGLDVDAAWARKCALVQQTPGLTVWRGGESFDDLGGLVEVKRFCQALAKSARFSAVIWMDEVEKMMAAMHTDTSGVSQDQHQQILTFMQDQQVPGLLLIGQPGSGKSAIAKALGSAMGVPTVRMDMGAMMGGLVGDSQRMIRGALKTLMGISQGRMLVVATCNDVGALERSPELMRRFKLPKWYFDLPTADEMASIWPVVKKRHGIAADEPTPEDSGWTGAEAEACCEIAALLKVSLVEAAQNIIPMALAQPDIVLRRREQAHGRFNNASASGVYQKPGSVTTASSGGRRMLGFERDAAGNAWMIKRDGSIDVERSELKKEG